MPQPVYFLDLKATFKVNRLQRIGRLLDLVPFPKPLVKKNLVAIKIHFGEKGNTAFIRPLYVHPIADKIREWGGKPFLTDTNTFFLGTRSDSVTHLQTALENGFSFSTVGSPLIIAGGIRGNFAVQVPVEQHHFATVSIAADIVEADALIGLAHFKGHELTGFGGALKNLGLGCATREGKMLQHSTRSPKVKRKRCLGCGECILRCPAKAIVLQEDKAVILPDRCARCAECLLICPEEAIQIRWDPSITDFQQKMVEYAYGVLKGKAGRAVFMNFLTDITPACDCHNHSDRPIVRDIGILASTDPVAIDQASVDLVNNETGNKDSALAKNYKSGEDKFKGVYPEIDWEIQLSYAEQIGLGTRKYELVVLGEK